MAILEICKWGHPVLKTKAKTVDAITDEIKKLVGDMYNTMAAENGLGLAANQVGITKRIFVVEIPSKSGPAEKYAMINPILVSKSKAKDTADEGCLSFPNIYGPVERSEEVEIRAMDIEGKSFTVKGTGLLARALQHELDHLDAIVFVEKMNVVYRMRFAKQLRALAKQTKQLLMQKKVVS
ncbi:peptide deformylase [bacterium]|nr:peptide deformylase [bacterium]